MLPGERSWSWAIDKLVGSGSLSAVPPLLRILSSDSYLASSQFSRVVGTLAKGRLQDRRLADKLLAMYKDRAEKSQERVAKHAFFGMDNLARAIFNTGGEDIVPVIVAMVTDRNPSIRELAFKVFGTSQRVEGLKPILAVAGSICRNSQWDDEAFEALQSIAKANGVSSLRGALESLMMDLDAGTFYGCMDVAGRLLQWIPLSREVLDVAGGLPLKEVGSTYCKALRDQDQTIRVRAAELLLARLSVSGETLTLLEQTRSGHLPSEEAANHLQHALYDYRGKADTMLEKEYKRANTLLKPLPWRHVAGKEAVRIANQGGFTFSGPAETSCVVLIAPTGMVHDGDVEYEGRLNGVSFKQTCNGSVSSSGATVEASGHNYMIMTSPFSAYVDGKRTTMIALVFFSMDGGEAPDVLIHRIAMQ